MAKYKIPVSIQTWASATVGEVECDSAEEFRVKAEELWESQGFDAPGTNISNDFEIGDWELSEVTEDDLKYYKDDD